MHASIIEFTTPRRNPLEHKAAIYVLSERIFDNREIVQECMTSLLETHGKFPDIQTFAF